jgi:class 3 adenylate cyclase/HAMP domain-containing protein
MSKKNFLALQKYFNKINIFKKKKRPQMFRTIVFGVRTRILALLTLVMVVILTFIAVILYQHQKEIIHDEKMSNVETLTRILSGPAELYLDRGVDTTDGEAKLKFDLIEKEAVNFKSYNADISKIIITDEKGITRYSTDKKETGADMKKSRYISKALELQENTLGSYDPNEDESYLKKLGKKKPEPYLAILYPVYLKNGLSIDILNDYKKYYTAYHEAQTTQNKIQIFAALKTKYKDILGEDFNAEPVKKKEPVRETKPKTSAAKGQKKEAVKETKIVKETKAAEKEDEVTRVNDIDFLFHRLITHAMKSRNKSYSLSKKDAGLIKEDWLFSQKKQKNDAKKNDLLSKENQLAEDIKDNISKLADSLEKSRRLGIIAVVFNTEKIEKERERILHSIIIPLIGPVDSTNFVLVLFLVIAVAFFIVLNYMVKNIKKLELWAMDVAAGNLGKKIEIESNDEIGRLGDAFNHMLKEIVVKYHLEKFVSSSTKTMIAKQSAESASISLGVTERKNFAFIFSDVRGFTSFSEKNDPETVIDVLNFYLELQSEIVKSNRGDIDDYVGDQIMAHFSGERRADIAIECAIRMMKDIRKTNEVRLKQGLPVFEVGMGIHGGDVVTGNIGSKFRMDYACVGDAVNLTSRLCSAAPSGEIYVSQELFLQAKKKYPHEIIPPITVKGKKATIAVVRLKV